MKPLLPLDDALAKAVISGERGWSAEIHRLRGELTGRLAYPEPAKAEDSFRTALAVAREQGTRGYELRAATSLAPQPGEARGGAARRATCSRPSTAGLLKASTPLT